MLRPSQPFRLLSRVSIGARAAMKDYTPFRRLVDRALTRRETIQNPALALDHHVADIRGRRADQRYHRRSVLRPLPHRLRSRSRLAEPAPAQDEPVPPVTVGRQLLWPRPV